MTPESAESKRTRTILLVEDEESTRSFIQRFLERDGYEVVAVDAAEEGIVESGELMPDVLISDIHLPGLSGIELASFLLAQDPALPVILMTGDPDEGLARRALDCGPVQYLLKPFEWFEMEAAVGFALRQRDAVAGMLSDSMPAIAEPTSVPVGDPIDADPAPTDDVPLEAEDEVSVDPVPVAAVEVEAVDNVLEWPDPDPTPIQEAAAVVGDLEGSDPDDTPIEDAGEEEPVLEWPDPEPVSTTEAGMAESVVKWPDPEPVTRVETEAVDNLIEWPDPEPLPTRWADEDPEETSDWVELEPVPDDGAEAMVAEWVELEPIPDLDAGPVTSQVSDPSAQDLSSLEPQEPDAADAADAAGWLDQVDRASYAGVGHGDRVSRMALALYEAMDEPGVLDSHDLGLAARVHEVGRLHLPDGEPVELAMRGAEVLAEAGFPVAVTDIVRHMHERWDGTSGPDELSGTRIPMGAQLLAVADALDHYCSAWIRSGLEPGESANRALNLVTVQQNLAFSPIAVGAMHMAADTLREVCSQERPPEASEPSPIPALAAAESVPFALFASE